MSPALVQVYFTRHHLTYQAPQERCSPPHSTTDLSTQVQITASTPRSRTRMTFISCPVPTTQTHCTIPAVHRPGIADLVDEHLITKGSKPDLQWEPITDVTVDGHRHAHEVTAGRLAAMFARSPGCLVAAVGARGGRGIVGTRAGWMAEVITCAQIGEWGAVEMLALSASFTHAWIVAGLSPAALIDMQLLAYRRPRHHASVLLKPTGQRRSSGLPR